MLVKEERVFRETEIRKKVFDYTDVSNRFFYSESKEFCKGLSVSHSTVESIFSFPLPIYLIYL